MSYTTLATDYDGTLARDGVVDETTVATLDRLRESAIRTILVTGRRIDSLQRIRAPLERFDVVVAENGAVIFEPHSGAARAVAPSPEAGLVEALKREGVAPLHVGESIVATLTPMEAIVRRVLAELRLDSRIVFNKGALMILPRGIDKAFGLGRSLRELGLDLSTVVGVGDAENDIPFLQACGCSAAVANALPAVKAAADMALVNSHGAGVVELCDRLWPSKPARRRSAPSGTT